MTPAPDDTGTALDLTARGYDHPDAQALVQALYQEQLERYGTADAPEADPDEYQPPGGLFLLGYRNGQPVACGGYRTETPGTVEIKKMYVQPELRGHGYGRAVLTALENAARSAGAHRIILETGVRNTEALTLYTHAGYHPTPTYRDRDQTINRALIKNLT